MGICNIRPDLSSRYIARVGSSCLLLPAKAKGAVIILHGVQESPEILLRNCPIEELAEELQLAILLPELGNSFGLDWGEGQDYRSFLMQELLPWAQAQCPVFALRERCVIGGISMGGFAALSIALSFPETFGGAFSLSGALDSKQSVQFCRICGIPVPDGLSGLAARPEARLSALLETAAYAKPTLYLAWGDNDWFIKANTAFAARAEALDYLPTAVCGQGKHNWDFWRKSLPEAFRWAASFC